MNYLFFAAVIGIVACHGGGGGGFGGSFGGRGSRTGGGSESNEDFGGRHPHRLEPSFLRGLNRTAKDEFFAIGRKDDETINQQKDDVLAWAAKYNLTEQVKQFEANLTTYRAQLAQNVSDLIANLPTIQDQIQTIFKNEDQTRKELWNALEEVKNSSRKEVDVLFFIASRFRKHSKGPRGGEGPFPGPFTGGNFGGPGGAGGRGGPQGGPQNFGGFGNGQQGFGGQPGFGGNQGFRGGPGSPQQQTIGRGAAPFGGNSLNNNNDKEEEEETF